MPGFFYIILKKVKKDRFAVKIDKFGIRIERNRQTSLELQKEHVSTIAVVNMDDGVAVDNEHVNYASKLISFPNDRFLVTGLADAKAGIENGTYAAYVIIPETFSASVASIENAPEK